MFFRVFKIGVGGFLGVQRLGLEKKQRDVKSRQSYFVLRKIYYEEFNTQNLKVFFFGFMLLFKSVVVYKVAYFLRLLKIVVIYNFILRLYIFNEIRLKFVDEINLII